MTAAPAPARPARPARARPAGQDPADGIDRGHRRDRGAATPATLRRWLTALILLSLAWGAVGGWVAVVHSSAARAVIATDEPLSTDARQLYEAVADADATITASLLASSQPPLTPLRRYQGDLATASAELARLRTAGGSPAVASALAAIGGGLPAYAGYVADAQGDYALGYPLTGGSFLQVASEQAHLVLLPNAKIVFDQENAALGAASSQATGLPLVVVALVLALSTGIVSLRAQRWLTGHTNRVFSLGLVLGLALLVISALWLAAGFVTARSDLDRGIEHGSTPAQDLAQASIDVQQIRGDAVLYVISRSSSDAFDQDFQATSKRIGPGAGSLLTDAAAAQPDTGQAASLVASAQREATAWATVNARVYALGQAANYVGERSMVVGTGAGGAAAGYQALEPSLESAIGDDQAAFLVAARQGSGALDPLPAVVIAAALLMAAGCWQGLRRRLAEYR